MPNISKPSINPSNIKKAKPFISKAFLISQLKSLGLFMAGDYIGRKFENMTRPSDKQKLKEYLYKKPKLKEELIDMGKTVAISFVPVIGDISAGIYSGYVNSRIRKRGDFSMKKDKIVQDALYCLDGIEDFKRQARQVTGYYGPRIKNSAIKTGKKVMNFSGNSMRKVASKVAMQVSKVNPKAAKLMMKYPKTVGLLIGLSLASAAGGAAYAATRKKSQDADQMSLKFKPDLLDRGKEALGKSKEMLGKGKEALGKSKTAIMEKGRAIVNSIKSYKAPTSSQMVRNLKAFVAKYPKTSAFISGTAKAAGIGFLLGTAIAGTGILVGEGFAIGNHAMKNAIKKDELRKKQNNS